MEAEQLEVNRQFVPYTVDCGRWSEVVAFCDVSHIPLNAGYDNSVCTWPLPFTACQEDLDLSIHNDVCEESFGPVGGVSVRNNRECSPLGIECPGGAPAALARRVDKPVVPLDSKKLLSNVQSFRSAHDFSVGQSLGEPFGGECSRGQYSDQALFAPQLRVYYPDSGFFRSVVHLPRASVDLKLHVFGRSMRL